MPIPRTLRPGDASPWPQLDTRSRMACIGEQLARLGQSQPFHRTWNLRGWPVVCRPGCFEWWWPWAAMFPAVWFQETEDAGGREQLRHRERGWDESPKAHSLLPGFSCISCVKLWDTPQDRVPEEMLCWVSVICRWKYFNAQTSALRYVLFSSREEFFHITCPFPSSLV